MRQRSTFCTCCWRRDVTCDIGLVGTAGLPLVVMLRSGLSIAVSAKLPWNPHCRSRAVLRLTHTATRTIEQLEWCAEIGGEERVPVSLHHGESTLP